MSAPPDYNHTWRLDQNGRWYYLDRDNRPVFDPRIPRTVPPATNVASSRPSEPSPNPQYQHRITPAPQSDSGPPRAPYGAQNTPRRAGSLPPASAQPPNAFVGQPGGRGVGRGNIQPSGPVPIPTTAAQAQLGTGQGRGAPGAAGAYSLPGPGFAQVPGFGRGGGQYPAIGSLPAALPMIPQGAAAGRERGPLAAGISQPLPNVAGSQQLGVGRGRGQIPAGIPYGPPQPGNAQAVVVGRGRAVPGNVGPQPPPAVGSAQQSGVGGRRGQLPAGGPNPPSQSANTQILPVGRGRGNVPVAAIPTNSQPGASQSGNAQRQQLIATPEQRITLNEDYRVRQQPMKFFRLGKVFLTLHTENYGQSRRRGRPSTFNTSNNDVFVVSFGELVFTKVRRFIVVREDRESCSALAITTHNGRGAAQRNASEHGVVYTGAAAPPARFRNEADILPTAIRIDPFDEDDTLHSASRVNYGKVYNIEHNVKVKPYGVVNNQFMHSLITQWTQVFIGRTGNPAQLAFRTPGEQTLRGLGFTPSQITSVTNILTRRGANPYDVITSMARVSAEQQLAAEDRAERTVRRLANHVVDLILAGMTYPNAVSHVKLITANEEADDDDDDDDDEDEDEDDD